MLQVLIHEHAPIAVLVEPIVQECLVEIGCNDLLGKFVRLGRDKCQTQTRQDSDQRLRNPVRAGGTVD
jgi:hypothetical protein